MDDKSKIFDQLQTILNQLKSDLQNQGLELKNLSAGDAAKFIKKYVPEELASSAIEFLSQNNEYSFEPLSVYLPDDQDHSELIKKLHIDPKNELAIIHTLPLTAYFLGRVFCYNKPGFLNDRMETNDLRLTAMLEHPVYNLQGVYRLEQILQELHLQNFNVLLNGTHGVMCQTNPDKSESDELCFTVEASIRFNNLIDGCRVYIKMIGVSESYKYEILDGQYVFYNHSCSSDGDFNLALQGLSELEFIVVKEAEGIGSVDVMSLEHFTHTGLIGQTSSELSLRSPDRQSKIGGLFLGKLEKAIVENYADTALKIMSEFAQNIQKPPHNTAKETAPKSPVPFFNAVDDFKGLPS